MRVFGTKSIWYSAPVHFGVAALPAETPYFADRHALHAEILERRLHGVEDERLDDGDHELQRFSPPRR